MPRDDLVYIGHMLDVAREALELAGGKTRRDYDSDKALRVALAHFVQVVGEAARHVTPARRDEIGGVPWHEIVGMRHKIVHDYMDVDEDVVWEVVTADLPPLIAVLERIVPPDETA